MGLRLNFIVEGQTEERFVNMVLRNHFAVQSIVAVAHCVTTRRDRRARHVKYRGGLTTYRHARDSDLPLPTPDRHGTRYPVEQDRVAGRMDTPSLSI